MTDTAATPAAATDTDAAGLLDSAKPIADAAKTADPAASTVDHLVTDPTQEAQQKAIDKRQRPATIPEKFWDSEKGEPRVEDLAKAHAELEKNFHLGKHKAPEGGKYELGPLAEKTEDPVVKAYVGWAQKHGLSQAAFDELAKQVQDIGGNAQAEAAVSKKAEMEKLGEQGPAIISSMVTWAQSLVAGGVWTAEDFEEFKYMGGTANGMRSLMRLRESYEGRIALKDTIPNEIGMSDEELHARVGHPDYQVNKGGYRDKTEQLFTQRYGGQGRAA